MKLTAILLLGACLQLAAKTTGQTVTLDMKNAPMQKVFKEVSRQTGMSILYTSQLLEGVPKVTISVKNASLEEVLDLVFKGQQLDYEVNENTVVIKHKSEGTNTVSQVPSPTAIDVHGVITDENGAPAQGVNVMVKGTNKGTTTNLKGEFVLSGLDENAVLLISSVGYNRQEILVKNKSLIAIQLKLAVGNLDELQVIAYGTTSKRLSTGNIATVKASDIEKQPVQNPLLALIGRVPGVTIEQSTGFANSGVVVRIQGTNSIASGLDPLYVIDGVPYPSQPFPTIQTAYLILGNSGTLSGGGNPLSYLNPQDIESIDVLKDADATAIYGSRGANGVILITTKKGKAGKTKFDVSFRQGWGQIANKVDLLNTEQYIAMRKEGYTNDGSLIPDQNTTPLNSNYDLTFWDQDRFTDWQNVLIGGTAKNTDIQIGSSGGNKTTQYLIRAGYHKETTVFPGNFDDVKTSLHFSINHTNESQKFQLQFSGTYVADNNRIPTADPTQFAMSIAPNAPSLYNSDGTLNWQPLPNGNSTWTNPLSFLKNWYQNKANNLIANTTIGYRLFPGLNIKTNFGYTKFISDEISTNSLESQRPEIRSLLQRFALYSNGSNASWIMEPQVTYDIEVRKGKLAVLLGSTFQENNTDRKQLGGSGHASDLLLKDIAAASAVSVQSTLSSTYKYNAIFSRINYNLDNKYVLNLIARRDGSSRFGSENLFNNFWSVAGAWIFSNERFLKRLDFISFGKLRVSYGTSGNDQIGDYGFLSLYNPVTSGVGVPYQGIPAMAPTRHTNQYLQWEETSKLQFGLDLGFFNDRILLNANYYQNRSSNLLVSSRLSAITGFPGVIKNFEGFVQNAGWELSLNSNNIQTKNIIWRSSINLTIPVHNGVLASFPGIENTTYSNIYTVGRSINDSRVTHYLGVNPSTGLYEVADKNGNPVVGSPSLEDATTFVNTFQQLYGGIQNSITYKGFSLDFTFQFVKRNARSFLGLYPGVFNGLSNTGNQGVVVLDRWQKSGDVNSFQKFTATNPISSLRAYLNYFRSDGAYTSASYIKLTNFALAYRVPEKWLKSIHLQDANFFFQAQNVFTIKTYSGLDPSTGSSTALPPLRLIIIGTNISF